MNNDIDFDAMSAHDKLRFLDFVNNLSSRTFQYGEYTPDVRQLIDAGYLEVQNARLGEVALRPMPKLLGVCRRWDRMELQRQIDNTTPRNLAGGVNFGCA